jgi:esterase/lipase superfamily enzyme
VEDPSKHIVLRDVEILGKEQLVQRLRSSESGRVMLFVHGYNTSFQEAARRTAQLAFDLRFQGIAGFFSWPSSEKTVSYTVDEQNIEWSRGNLERFLSTILRGAKPDSVVIIAHSMWSRSVSLAVKEIVRREPRLAENVRELILAAPDIDRDVFLRDIAPTFNAFNNKPTVYVSSNDKALAASRKVHGAVRIGDASVGIVGSGFFDTIDASDVDTSFLGHSYYGSNVSLILDIDDVLRTRRDPVDRLLLEPGDAKASYWRFRKQRE